MEFFAGAPVVRWQSIHNKYPVAEDDEKRVSQHQDRSSSGARWTVEVVTDILHQPCLRLKSCHGRYLAAPLRKRAFLRLAGTKAAQKFPGHPGAAVEWQPLHDGFHVLLRCFFRAFLRANGGPPSWQSSVTVEKRSWWQCGGRKQHAQLGGCWKQPLLIDPCIGGGNGALQRIGVRPKESLATGGCRPATCTAIE